MKANKILTLVFISVSHILLGEVDRQKLMIHFETASALLTAESKDQIDGFLQPFSADDDIQISLIGHTDQEGDEDYNRNLSMRRAEAVKQYIIGRGFSDNSISMDYAGENQLLKTADDDRSKAENRRVELQLVHYHFDSLEELEAELRSKPQVFEIDPSIDNRIEAENGSKVGIPAGSFVDNSGNPITETVKFQVTEALTLDGFIANQLVTKSGERILESGGMLKLEAYTMDGRALQLKSDKSMQLEIPTEEQKEGMELFYSKGGQDWETKAQRQTLSYATIDNGQEQMIVISDEDDNLLYEYSELDRPSPPDLPEKAEIPDPPQQEDFMPNNFFYRNFASAKRRAIAIRKYNDAIKTYYKSLAKHQSALDRYERNMVKYEMEMLEYKEQIAAWEKKVMDKKLEFYGFDTPDQVIAYEDSLRFARMDDWQKTRELQRQQAVEDFENAVASGNADMASVNDYVFNASQLGWVNVDRFVHLSERKKFTLAAIDQDRGKCRVFVAFNEDNSVLELTQANGRRYEQPSFPKTVSGKMIAYKVKNGKPLVYVKQLDGSQNYDLEYKVCTFKELQNIIDGLG